MALNPEESKMVAYLARAVTRIMNLVDDLLGLVRTAGQGGAVDIASHNNNSLAHDELLQETMARALAGAKETARKEAQRILDAAGISDGDGIRIVTEAEYGALSEEEKQGTMVYFVTEGGAGTEEPGDGGEENPEEPAPAIKKVTWKGREYLFDIGDLAPLDSPAFTGTPTVPTVDNLNDQPWQIANVVYVNNVIRKFGGVIGGPNTKKTYTTSQTWAAPADGPVQATITGGSGGQGGQGGGTGRNAGVVQGQVGAVGSQGGNSSFGSLPVGPGGAGGAGGAGGTAWEDRAGGTVGALGKAGGTVTGLMYCKKGETVKLVVGAGGKGGPGGAGGKGANYDGTSGSPGAAGIPGKVILEYYDPANA
jgi:hypothetical protein